MSSQFQKAVELVNGLPKDGPVQPTQDDQLKFYGLYKQATKGDVNTSRPGMFDMQGKYKWDAWNSRKGMSQEDAEKEYVQALKDICERMDNDEAKDILKKLEES